MKIKKSKKKFWFLILVAVCSATSYARADLSPGIVMELKNSIAELEDKNVSLIRAFDSYFSDGKRKRLSLSIIELNKNAFLSFSELYREVKTTSEAREFEELVDLYFAIPYVTISSSYIEWPFAGLSFFNGSIDEGSDSIENIRDSLAEARQYLIQKYK